MAGSTTTQNRPPLVTTDRPGPLGRLADLSFRRRGRVVLGWLAALLLAIGLSAAFGGDYNADYSAPGSDSSQAQDLLETRFTSQAGDVVDVVVRATGSADGVNDPGVRSDVAALLAGLRDVPHVASVDDPYATPGGISADGRTLHAGARLDVVNPNDVPVEDAEAMIAVAEKAERDGLQVALGGQSVTRGEAAEIGSEGIGLAAAAL